MTRFGQPKTRKGWRFAHLLLLLVLAWQGVVLQSHTHFAAANGAPVGTTAAMPLVASATAVAHANASTDVPATVCLLCEEQALFGAYVLAAPVAIVAPVAEIAWYDAIAGPYSTLSRTSHSWRSRAPPTVHLSTI